MAEKRTTLKHLKSAVEKARDFTDSLVAQVADLMVSAIEELNKKKADTNHKHTSADITDLPTSLETTAVKGDAEEEYRTGKVNLTPENIGALPVSGGIMNGTLTAAPETTGIAAVRNIRYGTVLPDVLDEGEIFILLEE